jgi:hypothetical protein
MKLNLGSGNSYLPDYTNIDKSPHCKVDLRLDIEDVPWPIESNSVEHILSAHCLEHIHQDRFPDVVREMYRISQSGAAWMIYVPHGITRTHIKDPTHRMPFTFETFNYWADGTPERDMGILYGWGDIHLKVIYAKLSGESIDFKIEVVK